MTINLKLDNVNSTFMRWLKPILLSCLFGININLCLGQSLSGKKIVQLANENLISSLNEYREFLSIPNNGRVTSDIEKNLNWCIKTFKELNFETHVLTEDGIPHLLAQKVYNKKYKTILFYLQIDGQPVDSTQWSQDQPYQAQLKKWEQGSWKSLSWSTLSTDFDPEMRVFGRSSSDSKGPAMTFITALRILKKIGVKPNYNMKVVMDFQEELGSPKLAQLVNQKAELFDADMMLVMDGTRHLSNLPTLTFGARGLATVKLKVFGSKRNLHSGQYGNFAPNPVFTLSRLIATLKDAQGKVSIPGFYNGVHLTELEKNSLNDVPENLDSIKKSLGIASIDKVGETYQESLQYPSLNIRGLKAAWVDKEVRTLIPSEAIAEIDMRLVPETPGKRQVELLRNHINDQGFHFVDSIPTEKERQTYTKLISMTHRLGSKPFRTAIDSDIGNWLSNAMSHVFGKNYVKMRTTGGSQPMAPFINALGLPAVSVRIPNPDNNIHAPNENLRLGNYLEGIQTCLSILIQDL